MAQHFQLVGDHPVLDFANTLDYRYEPAKSLELLESVADLVRFGSESGLLKVAEANRLKQRDHKQGAGRILGRARELREGIERIFAAVSDGRTVAASDLDGLNAWVQEASPHRSIERRNHSFLWRWQDAALSPEGVLWRIAQAAAELLTSPEARLVGRCSADNCRWLFLDKSKNHSRRWCDMRICGNRQKAQAYYRRITAGP